MNRRPLMEEFRNHLRRPGGLGQQRSEKSRSTFQRLCSLPADLDSARKFANLLSGTHICSGYSAAASVTWYSPGDGVHGAQATTNPPASLLAHLFKFCKRMLVPICPVARTCVPPHGGDVKMVLSIMRKSRQSPGGILRRPNCAPPQRQTNRILTGRSSAITITSIGLKTLPFFHSFCGRANGQSGSLQSIVELSSPLHV